MRRRSFLGLLGGTTLSGVAGCLSGESNSPPPNNTTNSSDSPSAKDTSEPEPAEFEITDRTPESASLNETFQLKIEVRNVGGEDGTWESQYSAYTTAGPEPESSNFEPSPIEVEISAGDSHVWTSNTVSYDRPSVVYYRIGGGETRSIEVPESRAPIIEETNLVSEWSSFGDALENELSRTKTGSTVHIASRYWYWAESKTNDTFRQVEIYDSNDERVDIQTASGQQVIERNGWQNWESYLSFDSTDWSEGTYTARMLIRDNQNQEVSNAGTVEFELV